MSLNIQCPLTTTVPPITDVNCEEHFGQIVRCAFTRAKAQNFADQTAFGTEVAWDTALGASDDTQIQITPLFNNFVIPEGAAATIGPDTNETLFGELKVVGSSAITCTGRFQGLPFSVKAELEAYISEGAVFGNMGVILIDEFGKAYAHQPEGNGTPIFGIPISSFYIGDVGSEGYNTLSYTPFQFNLKGGWANLVISEIPDFDLITKANV